jgi:hypothetical protein
VTANAPVRAKALLAFLVSFTLLLANGRAIGSGDTHAVERTAASLVERQTLVLPDEGGPDPFTRAVPGGRISIYPALPALMAAPVFFLCRLFFDLNPAGVSAAGKLTAALLSAIAVALLFAAFYRRASPRLSLVSALLFGLGTSVYSTSQALWQHPAVLLFMVIAISALERVDALEGAGQLVPALTAALSLSLAAASRPAAVPMCAVLFLFLLHRARVHAPGLIAIACVPAALVASYNTLFFGAPWRFGAAMSGRFFSAFPESIAGLLVSPARGLFVFTPIAVLALLSLLARARRSIFARGLLAAVLTHFFFMATWNEWHGGESFGPRLLTDLLPPLFFFLPEALRAWPKTGTALGILSLTAQFVGGFTYDYRWERLHQRGREFDSALWSVRESPLLFAASEGVLIQGLPVIEGRRLRLQSRRFVPFGPEGSLIEVTPTGLRASGRALIRDIRLERGARLSAGWVTLAHPGDALAFRLIEPDARELRLTGSLRGTLRIEGGTGPIFTPLDGDFDVTLPLRAMKGEEVFVRAESGELRLGRLEVK